MEENVYPFDSSSLNGFHRRDFLLSDSGVVDPHETLGTQETVRRLLSRGDSDLIKTWSRHTMPSSSSESVSGLVLRLLEFSLNQRPTLRCQKSHPFYFPSLFPVLPRSPLRLSRVRVRGDIPTERLKFYPYFPPPQTMWVVVHASVINELVTVPPGLFSFLGS